MALSGRSTQFRLLFILGSVVIVLFAFFPLHSSIGRAAALAPLVVPMLVVAWFYGLRGAVIASLVSLPVSILMGNLADQTWDISISFMWITATIFRVTLACTVGRLRDVYQNLRNSEAALEVANAGLETQVAIRIEAFSKQQEVISEAQSLAKFGTIQRDLQTGEGWWSDEVYTILGIAPQKPAPTLEAFLEHVHPHDVERLKETMATSRKTGYREGEYRVVRSNGGEVTFHSRAKVYFDEEENPVRLIGTILDITERKQAEVKVREAQMELRALSRHLIQAQETERRRIALDLHDRLGQELALLSIEIDQLRQKAPQSQAQLAEQMQKLAVQVRKLSSQVQTLSHRLHPSTLAHLGLVAASKGLCHEVSESSDIQINFSHSDVSKSIPQDVSTCLFRVLQESLTNVVKHSGAKTAQVELAGSSSEIQLQILDSGVGFDPKSTGSRGGLGLISMRERLILLGGELLIESRPSGSTWIKACLPLKSSASPIEHPSEIAD